MESVISFACSISIRLICYHIQNLIVKEFFKDSAWRIRIVDKIRLFMRPIILCGQPIWNILFPPLRCWCSGTW